MGLHLTLRWNKEVVSRHIRYVAFEMLWDINSFLFMWLPLSDNLRQIYSGYFDLSYPKNGIFRIVK
jgi:hypothetical protein